MSSKFKLEALNAWHDRLNEVGFPENAECQREHWKIGVDRLQAVVAALIDINDIITEWHAAYYHGNLQSATREFAR
ncbi:hypothetical protein NLM31_07155 [Bradyrhizobium sp. CCGUVB4N]|nr:hypothetical protein [Bradyrhizobium sp. CCGUVB4N]MCP3380187.1 hypothetical protein [Bradyrhizobium sp. CCGUVB4N]